jgi:threonine dehydratase
MSASSPTRTPNPESPKPLDRQDLEAAREVIRQHLSPVPLIRSYALEQALGLPADRRVYLKDYGWTPVGSFKLMGALYWMHTHREAIGDRPVVAHSSGNFASGLAFAGQRYGKRVIVVMPDTAPAIKVQRTRSFGAEIRTFDLANDHKTGQRDQLTREIKDRERGYAAHPYDDPAVICGNGVGGLEIADCMRREGRSISHFFCAVSGGGLMAGHALAIADAFPEAKVIGVEPAGANDLQQSLVTGEKIRIDHPKSICDGLLSYDVGKHNWPILSRDLHSVVAPTDDATRAAMAWLYQHHGLRTEPSGAITTAAALAPEIDYQGQGDIVIVLSGRNVDEDFFRECVGRGE